MSLSNREFSELRYRTINWKKFYPLPEAKSGTLVIDFLHPSYENEHKELIMYLDGRRAKETIINLVPPKGRGFVRVYVKKVGETFMTDQLEFVPYHIIHMYWGLGFGNVNIDDFTFYECHYKTDKTKFRGCIKK
jgi:hypothetical protein